MQFYLKIHTRLMQSKENFLCNLSDNLVTSKFPRNQGLLDTEKFVQKT